MTVLDRAFSLLEVKSVSDETRTVEGWATTPKLDRQGDIVDWEGLTFGNSIKLLLYHNSTLPVGNVKFGTPTKKGLPFKASIPNVVEPGIVKDRVDEAWHSIKYNLIAAVSIGFRVLDDAIERIETGYKFLKTEILELSLVPIPANDQAVITSFKSMDAAAVTLIKSFDTNAPAATGQMERSASCTPGVTGKPPTKPVKLLPKEGTKMNATEHIAALETRQANLSASLQAIQTKVADEGRTKDESEKEESDNLKSELAQVVEEIKDARDIERLMIATAKPVAGGNVKDGSDARATSQHRAPVQIKRDMPKGAGFVRLLLSSYHSQKQFRPAFDIAKEMFGDTPEIEMVLRAGYDASNLAGIMVQRAAVTPMSTTDGSSGGNYLAVAENIASEFFGLLRAATILGRIPNLRPVPFNISVPRQLTDPTGYWVGQGDVKPVSRLTLDQVTLPFHKAAGIVPLTEELLKFSNPAAEGIVRTSLIGALTYLVDRDFLDPSKAETTGVSPASVTNGVTPIVASGTTADAFRADLGNLIATYLGLNMSPAGLVLVMTSTQAMRLGLMRNTLGQKEFPDIGIAGGTLEGIPVITSENIVATGGSPIDGYPIVAINAPEVMIADEGGVSIDVSREASLQMNDAPDSPESASTVLVSLWQRNMVAFRAERYITWKKGRTGAVQFIASAKYSE